MTTNVLSSRSDPSSKPRKSEILDAKRRKYSALDRFRSVWRKLRGGSSPLIRTRKEGLHQSFRQLEAGFRERPLWRETFAVAAEIPDKVTSSMLIARAPGRTQRLVRIIAGSVTWQMTRRRSQRGIGDLASRSQDESD